ncbi:Ubiquinone biosynthesis monooxygenase UbiB [Thioalkalivibrio nitratireducens DSM 14787]|uniref:Probable protein kinase UbiB n=1 Tax=Thioalkalivibrio nitratireducens (strain DSM 14787 / UNIQEM 213 / ALEN2) TaxID=1255043 RepID=L0DS37_THIND|nr:ubiquinone biosynthesis regulatory protein kinase UbiB [Thioalkalivibrio nitratireducens]AGA31802.1 Ubiquinone biosynthesis monooxygenase UbiB [Thioalkalivibrio nitratireducens DSM 14787]
MIRTFHQGLRLWAIGRVLVRYRLDAILFTLKPLRPLSFLLHLLPWNWFRQAEGTRGERIRCALEDLGPIFVKFGQMLSTRRDLLPDDLALELARLQDRVPAFPSDQARVEIEKALEQPIATVFAEFTDAPLASASIAQVHAARLRDGRSVVVKVVRPGIDRTIRADLEILHLIAFLADRYWADGRRLRPREVVAEYEKTVLDELDLIREGANAVTIRRHFEGSGLVYIPEVIWDYTRRNVMVMERISGIPVAEVDALRALGVNLRLLAERGVELFFTQVFRHNFFHADMHPGNIFVDASDPEDPSYLAVDFGIVGSLLDSDQHYLAENFYAFFNRDYRRVAELYVQSGWVPRHTRVDEFEGAIRSVCEPIFQKPLDQISFGTLLLRLFQTARRFDMEVQPQLVLLQKTLLNIEGLGRQLYPQLDLWTTAKPFIERWMSEQVGVRAFLRSAERNLPKVLVQLPELPMRLQEVLDSERDRAERDAALRAELRALKAMLQRDARRRAEAFTGIGLLIGAGVATRMDAFTHWHGVPWPSWALGLFGLALLFFSLRRGDGLIRRMRGMGQDRPD